MSTDIYILVIEDEPEVLDSLVRDLEPLEERFPVEMAATAEEARKVIRELEDQGNEIGLFLCDHVLPGENGVDLLVDMQKDEYTAASRKVLVTGQAGLEDTVEAVNRARLNYYIAKPWTQNDLLKVVKNELTEYVIETDHDPLEFMKWLNQERLAEHIHNRGKVSDS